MLDLQRLSRVELTAKPRGHRLVGSVLLHPNYRWLSKVDIEVEGIERLPEHAVLIAMNHTDRYNYWPLQYYLWRRFDRFTATWVKGKYYENPLVAKFMELTNNIPTVSRGYIVVRDFKNVMRRSPTTFEYEVLRELIDREAHLLAQGKQCKNTIERNPSIPAAVFSRRRDMLGRIFDPHAQSYAACVLGTFEAMMKQFLRIHEDAKNKGIDIVVFPQGTRSVRLSRGHVGMAQMALYLKRTIVPVGCNGCDKVYAGAAPWASSGKIIYRVGDPIPYEDMQAFHIPKPFTPFSLVDSELYRSQFEGLTDLVMDRINDLLDPPYQFSDDRSSQGVRGTDRFV